MRQSISFLAALALGAASATAFAASHATPAPGDKKMACDKNKDGMVSREEFMKHMEDMWTKMDEGKKGMITSDRYAALVKQLAMTDGISAP